MLARQERMFSANKPAARVQHNPLMSKVAGAPIRLVHQPGDGDVLHPGAYHRQRLPDEEQAEIAMLKAAQDRMHDRAP